MLSSPSASDLYTLFLGCDANFQLLKRVLSDAADVDTLPSVGYFVLERSPDNVANPVVIPKSHLPAHASPCTSTS
ncbi:hypothetical protein PILCRDRAFT_602 [Piloderma croceum F 1598]|uniref:Uncharacterized protein n=1 Tax=Piloderma croceum (strain F 1598) TaxID=765440 RepID=A0A0C3GLE2_PILCF|nr:hypothetical protein PILCRDRAFT_602 [Piloderma croceum F 1598]